MSTFRPDVQHQGPATHCIINGKAVGWLSCTAYATAMGIDKSTLGTKQPSGCSVRRMTGDSTAGLTLPQCAAVAQSMGVKVELHVGSNVGTPKLLGANLKAGRGAVVQGNTGALTGTRFKDTDGAINHAVWVNEGRDFGSGDIPKEVLVYDPAADGRREGIDESPSWWPWSLLLKFAGALHPWGEGDPRTLGIGRLYLGIFPDTEPHVVLRFGAHKTVPFPDRTRFADDAVHVHSRPQSGPSTVLYTVENRRGDLWVAFQRVKVGNDWWFGRQGGDRWIEGSQLTHEGGGT